MTEIPKFNRSDDRIEKDSFAHPELIQYDNDASGIRFSQRGDLIDWSANQDADDPAIGLAGYPSVIIKTESGNTYIAGGGLLYTQKGKGFYDMMKDDVDRRSNITIGEGWVVPKLLVTSPVSSVELRGKIGEFTGATDGGSDPWEVADELFERAFALRE